MTRHFISMIRTMALAFTAITLSFALNACGNKDEANINRFKEAVSNLDNTRHTLVDEFDYWPECGIRVTGSHLASLISLEELQDMLPVPLYVSGPHRNGQWDLENEDDFGHYNPKAIQYLADLAKKVVADQQFVKLTKPLVDEYLYRQMHIMMVIHDALYDGSYSQEERARIFNTAVETKGNEYDDYDAGFVLSRLNLSDDSYVFENIGYRFLHFWARRWSDGTIDQFYDGLSTIFKAYYPEYRFDPEYYWLFEEEEFDEEWYDDGGMEIGGTDREWYDSGDSEHNKGTNFENFVVIDGSELRLRLGPSTSADTFKWPDGTNRHPNLGERFRYLGESGDFYQIDFHGNALWVAKQFTHLEF